MDFVSKADALMASVAEGFIGPMAALTEEVTVRPAKPKGLLIGRTIAVRMSQSGAVRLYFWPRGALRAAAPRPFLALPLMWPGRVAAV